MQVEIQRIPPGIPIKYFDVDANNCDLFWKNLQRSKPLFIREINKTIIKPHRYLAFTFIGYDITYSINKKTKLVEKLKINESLIVYLPKWSHFRLNGQKIKQKYYTFLKMALYHEYKYHVYLYEDKQLDYLYKVLEKIKRPTLERVTHTIRQFQRRLIKEQEISHANAPKGTKFCFETPMDIIRHYKPKRLKN